MDVNAEDTLKAVRSAVIAGDYARLATLLPALESGEAGLGHGDLTRLHRLKAEAERTASCLHAALSGVRAARRRAAEIIEATKGLTTYDREGIKATVSANAPTSRRV